MSEKKLLQGMKVALVYPEKLEAKPLYDMREARISSINQILKDHGCLVTQMPRDQLPETLDDFDFVVAAGGDGTQLDTALRLRDPKRSFICGVRLFPERSVGYLCNVDIDGFAHFMDKLEQNNAPLSEQSEPLTRLQCFIDDVPIREPALNDILLTHACPARASRYTITFNQNEQKQCSSGLWIATNAGSHAASHSAGAPILDRADPLGCVFCVRELCQFSSLDAWNEDIDPIQMARFIPGEDELTIEILGSSLHLYYDGGLVEYSLLPHQKITFKYHPSLLRRLKVM